MAKDNNYFPIVFMGVMVGKGYLISDGLARMELNGVMSEYVSTKYGEHTRVLDMSVEGKSIDDGYYGRK